MDFLNITDLFKKIITSDHIKQEQVIKKNINFKVFSKKKKIFFWKIQFNSVLKILLKNRVHLGSHKSNLNPRLNTYFLGIRNNYVIINLAKIIPQLKTVLNLLKIIGFKKGHVAVVCSDNDFSSFFEKYTQNQKKLLNFSLLKHHAILSNYSMIEKASKKNLNYKNYSNFKKPDIIIVINPMLDKNQIILKEAASFNIPSIALCDTDVDFNLVTYPIICNTQSIASIFYFLQLFYLAYKDGFFCREMFKSNKMNIISKN